MSYDPFISLPVDAGQRQHPDFNRIEPDEDERETEEYLKAVIDAGPPDDPWEE